MGRESTFDMLMEIDQIELMKQIEQTGIMDTKIHLFKAEIEVRIKEHLKNRTKK